MKFINTEALKPGMRLARPIYSNKGVLLYDRGQSIKDAQSIQNIKGFGLIGLFVLEPAEPVPPMTEADKQFERFQTVTSFQIKDELTNILKTGKVSQIDTIAGAIIREYGNCREKIDFQQSLRSVDDFIYKHCLNTAILAALLSHSLNMPLADQLNLVIAALVHDIGKLTISQEIVCKPDPTMEELALIDKAEVAGYEVIGEAFSTRLNIRRICQQAHKMILDDSYGNVKNNSVVLAAKVLIVAGVFDKATSVRLNEDPSSEIMTIKRMMAQPHLYDPEVVKAITDSLKILFPGVSVELNTGEKALIIGETMDPFRPMVLSFKDNSIINLMDTRSYNNIEIVDIMKTMDNRHVIDTETLKKFGGGQ